MVNLYTTTVKYIGLAIKEFLPVVRGLADSSSGTTKEKLDELLEMYSDINSKISAYKLNFTDPNRFYGGEPVEIDLDINKDILENLMRLTLRLLGKWKEDFAKLKSKKYLTEQNKERLMELKELIWPLEALTKAPGLELNKYGSEGPLIFPGEISEKRGPKEEKPDDYIPLFPPLLTEIIPGGIKTLCEEFDFNYKSKNPNACMLLLRKILPLAIVRKFQQLGKEDDIKSNGEYLPTMQLLGKAQTVMSSSRIYDEICNYKFLIDSSQHIFTVNVYMEDLPRPAIALRIMLEDFFQIK